MPEYPEEQAPVVLFPERVKGRSQFVGVVAEAQEGAGLTVSVNALVFVSPVEALNACTK